MGVGYHDGCCCATCFCALKGGVRVNLREIENVLFVNEDVLVLGKSYRFLVPALGRGSTNNTMGRTQPTKSATRACKTHDH